MSGLQTFADDQDFEFGGEDDNISEFVASPTMSAFMQSEKNVRVLAGPIGGGKSVCCCHELMRMAQAQQPNRKGKRLSRFLVVRNTADQLRSTTFKTIKDWFPYIGGFGRWAATERTLYYVCGIEDGTIVETEWMLRALDDERDIANALSLEVSAMWGNECREMKSGVLQALLDRTNRYPSPKSGGGHASRSGAILDTNMPGMESYWEANMSSPPNDWSVHIQPQAVLTLPQWVARYGEDPYPELVTTSPSGSVFAVDPNADNVQWLAPTYYQDAVRRGTDDHINVYLRCQYGRTLSGLPVYDQTFDYNTHVSKVPLTAFRSESYPICIGLDFGRTPSAGMMQNTPLGRTQLLSELVMGDGETMGIQKFITTRLKPHMLEKYPGIPCYVSADPAGWQKSQINEKCPVDYLKEAGFRVVKPATNKPKLRIEAVETLLMRSAGAEPGFIIDPSCKTIIRGFRGGYKWGVNKQGDLTNDSEPVKNKYSHPHDGIQYAAMVIDGNHAGSKSSGPRKIQVAGPRGWV